MYSNLLLPPINFAGFLAAAPGQVRTMQLCEEKKKERESLALFFPSYLLRWHGSRNHKSWNIIKTNPQSRFCKSQSGLLHLLAADVCLPRSLLAVNSTTTFSSSLPAPHLTQPTSEIKELRCPSPEQTAVLISAYQGASSRPHCGTCSDGVPRTMVASLRAICVAAH